MSNPIGSNSYSWLYSLCCPGGVNIESKKQVTPAPSEAPSNAQTRTRTPPPRRGMVMDTESPAKNEVVLPNRGSINTKRKPR